MFSFEQRPLRVSKIIYSPSEIVSEGDHRLEQILIIKIEITRFGKLILFLRLWFYGTTRYLRRPPPEGSDQAFYLTSFNMIMQINRLENQSVIVSHH